MLPCDPDNPKRGESQRIKIQIVHHKNASECNDHETFKKLSGSWKIAIIIEAVVGIGCG
jgi:hypothetical protein